VPAPGTRLAAALATIDAANAADPNREPDGTPRELAYGQRMTAWLQRLEPAAPEPLQLAVRAQHIERWLIPRADYPEGRTGYKRWRSDLARHHAARLGEIMTAAGYPPEAATRAADLIQKKRLAHDPEAQTLEDVACLVFLQHYFAAFAAKHPRAKVIDIVRKTWRKMSDRGHDAATSLPLPDDLSALVAEAVG